MKKLIKTISKIALLLIAINCNAQNNKKEVEQNQQKTDNQNDGRSSYQKNLEIINADYGTCYTIGNYQICPETKVIKVGRMFGTAVIDAYGFFPEPSLNYDEETMIIFAGAAFFDKSNLNIDWQSVQLLSYRDDYSKFTDGQSLYYIRNRSAIGKEGAFDKNAYTPDKKEKSEKKYFDKYYDDEVEEEGIPVINTQGRKALFYVHKNTFYFERNPILEPFDVPNLRAIVSKDGFETDYITDGKQVLYGGQKGGFSYTEKNEKKYVIAKKWMIEGVDLPSLRVLGKNILADKNALYFGTNVIPFDKLNGFKFIIREME